MKTGALKMAAAFAMSLSSQFAGAAPLVIHPVVNDVPIEAMRRSANQGRHPALMSASQRRRLCPGRDCLSRKRSR